VAGAGLVLGLVVLVGAVPRLIRPTLDRSEIRTAKVETGAVEATLSATGIVVPEFEHVLSSPIDARVLRVLRRPGDPLEPGQTILDLDVSESRLAYDKLVERAARPRDHGGRPGRGPDLGGHGGGRLGPEGGRPRPHRGPPDLPGPGDAL
jgi:hypothetical protein